MIKDAEADQVSAKSYSVYDSMALRVTGAVDAYVPESIWIQIRGPSRNKKAFVRLTDEFRVLLGPDQPIG